MRKLHAYTIVIVLVLGMFMGIQVQAQDNVTLRVLIHQHPPLVEYMEEFNDAFTEKYPNIKIDMSVVNAGDLATVTQTRLTAQDVDIIDIAGFSNSVQPYMVSVEPPNWQVMIESGLLLDLRDQAFLDYYDPVAIRDAGGYGDAVYQINLGRTIYSGIYYNKDYFAEFGVEVPTTWDELVAACNTFKDAGIGCMTQGGGEGWPIFVGAYGLIGSLFPDQAGLVEGLWTGEFRWDSEEALVMWERMKVYAQDFMERGVSGIPGDAAAGRFAAGAVAMYPAGSWRAAQIADSEPDFEWGYFPWPGSDDPAANQSWFGKYDMGWSIAANSPHTEEALLYLEEFSLPENYQAFIDTVEFIPTQPTAVLETTLGQEIAPYLDSFVVGYEQHIIKPTGAGQWSDPFASYFQPFNEWNDAQALAERAQADFQAGLDNVLGE